MTSKGDILFDGSNLNELLELSWDEVEAWICRDDPIVFTVSDAKVLAQFGVDNGQLISQISVIEGGGDGVLFHLFSAVEKLAMHHELRRIVWQVHALNCQKSNPKLQRVLVGYNFKVIQPENGIGYYQKITSINDTVMRRERLKG